MTSPTVAAILAVGTGERVGLGIPEQLLKISGRPVIEHTLRVFEESRSPCWSGTWGWWPGGAGGCPGPG